MLLKKLIRDERGAFGSVELMFIVGIVVVVAGAIMTALSNSDSGLPSGANNVVNRVNDAINSGVSD